MKIACIIPARYGSERFPGKILAKINGKSMLQHVYERVAGCSRVEKIIVATDDKRIVDNVNAFGGLAIMTPECRNGTDRIAFTVKNIDVDIVVNVQGDEPLISAGIIDGTIQLMLDNPGIEMTTAAAQLKDFRQLNDTNVVKVVIDRQGNAMYFSRAAIPAVRQKENWEAASYLKHIGIYAYKKKFLLKYINLQPGLLEETEKLEQLRALENGYRIRVFITDEVLMSVDTKEDLEKVKLELRKRLKVE